MIKGHNKYEKLGETLQGFYTLETFAERLKISKSKAIYVLYRLRKLGFVKTSYGEGKKRIYRISLANKQKRVSIQDKINKSHLDTGMKISGKDNYYVHGRTPTTEESLIYAIKQRDVRYIIASLVLFRRIYDWNLLYQLAKKEDIIREVAALYEVSRKAVRKVRKMPKRFINLAKKTQINKKRYIIKGISSDDFKDIEKKWNVHIPLNLNDLEGYKK